MPASNARHPLHGDVLRRLPFASTWCRPTMAPSFSRSFTGTLEAQDIRHLYIRPRTPHLNGKVERSHRVDAQEFFQLLDQGRIADDIQLFNEKLREWENYYSIIGRMGHWTAKLQSRGFAEPEPKRYRRLQDLTWECSSGWIRTGNPPVNSRKKKRQLPFSAVCWSCRIERHHSRIPAIFGLRFVPRFPPFCRSFVPPKGKKRARSGTSIWRPRVRE